MNILVTGGAGFIGSHFVDYLLSNRPSWNITVLDNLTYSGELSNLSESLEHITFIRGDICDPITVADAIAQKDIVFNFAAESHVDKSIESSDLFIKTNIVGVNNLLNLSYKSEVKKFIQISTDEVYGSITEGSFYEDSPVMPNSPYSASKASAELLCRAFHTTYGMDVRITRSSNNYGTRQYPEKLIPLAIQNFLQKKTFPVYGTGENVREWIHVLDHCQAILDVTEKGKSGEIYNVGSGEEYSNLEILDFILAAMDLDAKSLEFVEDRKGHDFRYSVSTRKIEDEFNFRCTRNLRDIIPDLIDFYANVM